MSETKRILDEETRKALLGYFPFSPDATITYKPEELATAIKKAGLDSSYLPTFQLRSLKQSEHIQLKSNFVSIDKDSKPEDISKAVEANDVVVSKCIVGWSNLYDIGVGEEIVYNEKDFDKLWVRIPKWLRNKLVDKIRDISGLSSVEELSLR